MHKERTKSKENTLIEPADKSRGRKLSSDNEKSFEDDEIFFFETD